MILATTKAVSAIATLTFAGCAFLLATGSKWLEVPAVAAIGLPLGNLIAWIGLVALPTAVYFGIGQASPHRGMLDCACRSILLLSLALAVAWEFVCYGLAGNWACNFPGSGDSFRGSNEAAMSFWIYSIVTVALPLLVLSVLLLNRAWQKYRHDRSA